MRLEVNGHVAAEDADANSIKYLIGDLHSETETSILLHDGEGVFLEANGLPKRGFSLYYTNKLTGVEYASKNKKLKPRAVMRVLKHYLARDVLWRVDIAWLPITEAAVAEDKVRAWRRSKPAMFSVLTIIIGYVPVMLLVRFLLNAFLYEPLCASTGFSVARFTHGGGGGTLLNPGNYTLPTCWLTSGKSVELPTIIGDSAILLDTLGSILEWIAPLLLLVAVLYAISRYREHAANSAVTP